MTRTRFPTEDRRAAYYREKCFACHSDPSCVLARADRVRRNQNDCVTCHMVKRDLATFSHSALTNHRIVRQLGERYPEAAYHLTTADLPDLIYLNRPEGPAKPLPAITLLTAYDVLAVQESRYRKRFLEVLLQLLKDGGQEDPVVLQSIAREAQRDASSEGDSLAIRYFSMALRAGHADGGAYSQLGDLLLRAGRARDTAEVLEQGIRAFPFQPESYRLLMDAWLALHQANRSDETGRAYLDLFPEDAGMRARLERKHQ